MKILKIEQGTPEWLELRRVKIGSSDASVIMNANPWKNEANLWAEKMLGEASFVTDAMRRGTELEPRVRQIMSERHGVGYLPSVIQSEKYDWMLASVDGISGERLIEIKCPNPDICEDILKGKLPLHYFWQIQHQLAVTNLSECSLIAFDGTLAHEMRVPRDEEAIERLIAKEQAFWERMCNFEAPESVLPERTDSEVKRAVIEWGTLKADHDALSDKLEAARKKVIQLANGSPYQCCGVRVTKVPKPGSVDYKKIPQLEGVDLESFRKPGTSYWKVM